MQDGFSGLLQPVGSIMRQARLNVLQKSDIAISPTSTLKSPITT